MSLLINSLTSDQINSNFTLKCIDQVNTSLQNQINSLDTETYISDVDNIYVSSTSSTTYDPLVQFLTSVGTNNTVENNYDTCVLVGNNDIIRYADNVISLGSVNNVIGTATNQTTDVINIGHNSSTRNPANTAQMLNIVNIGSGNDIDNGSNIITMGNNLNHGSQLNNNIILSTNSLDTTDGKVPTAGSIIFQSSVSAIVNQGGQPSAQPRVNFLGDFLLNPRGQNVGDAFDGLTSFAIPNINGYIRIKYKGVPILIPVLLDSEANADVGDPTNVTEFP